MHVIFQLLMMLVLDLSTTVLYLGQSHDFSDSAASFVSTLLSSTSVTQSTVQLVVEHCSTLVSDIVYNIAVDVKSTLTRAGVADNAECVDLHGAHSFLYSYLIPTFSTFPIFSYILIDFLYFPIFLRI